MRTYTIDAKIVAPHHTKTVMGKPTTFPTADEELAWHAHAHNGECELF
jgi:hypothetical protein